MADYENTTQVNAPPQALFDYLADINNLPEYVRWIRSATPIDGGDAVHFVVELPDGQVMEGQAWFGVDRAAMRMAWGSEGTRDYRGELAVHSGDGSSQVWARISTARGERKQLQRGVDQTVAAIKGNVEGAIATSQATAAGLGERGSSCAPAAVTHAG